MILKAREALALTGRGKWDKCLPDAGHGYIARRKARSNRTRHGATSNRKAHRLEGRGEQGRWATKRQGKRHAGTMSSREQGDKAVRQEAASTRQPINKTSSSAAGKEAVRQEGSDATRQQVTRR
ncbi:hypothetical protein CBR_g50744 [Chara braunii]|uniref:Uncharacterized protein n=1 Tax=Chara braunii TaxID=69332 RepID=A0A388K614_CHABU|nr:hypothetical protein CBR_g50744 [Chara braunii]|eukprot:GBG65383.1 hypothetical protein CBR_g50744 [Chara braunii]